MSELSLMRKLEAENRDLRAELAEQDRIIAALKRPLSREECEKHGEIADPEIEGSPYIFNGGDFELLIASRSQEAQKGATE